MLLKTFVLEKKYLTEEELVDYYSFCQLLPGASSTQIIGLIGYKRGGIILSIITLLIWIIPACIFMGAFSFFITSSKYEHLTSSVFRFIQPMAIGFLAFATYKMYFLSIKNTITQIIMLSSTVLTFLFFKSPWIFPLLIILGGIATNFSNKRIPKVANTKPNKISWNNAWLFILIFLFAGILSESARNKEWPNRKAYNLFENFYRFGSIVFGGGDVLIPMMLDQYVARPQSKSHPDFNSNATTTVVNGIWNSKNIAWASFLYWILCGRCCPTGSRQKDAFTGLHHWFCCNLFAEYFVIVFSISYLGKFKKACCCF